MELILRGSEYQDFLTCRKKWYHGWVEKITPKKPDGKLFFGNLMHKWLEMYYQNDCDKLVADLTSSVWFNEQPTDNMEQTEIDDLKKLFAGVTEYYHETYGESDKKWNVLGTEVEFVVKLQDDIYYTGTIDLIYEVDGKVRFADHKNVASIQMYEDKARMDRQISRYWWALQQISKGIGMIKVTSVVAGEHVDSWQPWDVLLGKEIDGFDYNIIAKDFPREPKILKSGKLSTDKSQKTTYQKYVDKLFELNLPYSDYEEVLELLKNKPDPFLKRIDVIRTQNEIDSSIWEMLYTAGDLHDIKMLVTEKPEIAEEVTYRNIGQHCDHMCQFKTLCMATIAGDNVSLVRNLGYKENDER